MRKNAGRKKLHNGDALSDLVETFALLSVSRRFYIFYIAYGLSRSKLAYNVFFCEEKSLFWKCATVLLLRIWSLILSFYISGHCCVFSNCVLFRADGRKHTKVKQKRHLEAKCNTCFLVNSNQTSYTLSTTKIKLFFLICHPSRYQVKSHIIYRTLELCAIWSVA